MAGGTILLLSALRVHDPLRVCMNLPMPSCRGTFRCQVSAGTLLTTGRCHCTWNRTERRVRPKLRASSEATSPRSRSSWDTSEGKTPAPRSPSGQDSP